MIGEGQRIAGIKPGLRVFVSAGAGGIGRTMAESFIAHGARLAVCDVDEAALENFRTTFPDHLAMGADVADAAAVDRCFEAIEEELGGLDVLVNNAGIAGPTAPVEEISLEDWKKTIDIDLTGHFHCLRRAVPLLKQAEDGAIINISSVAGRLGYAYRLPYAAAKWGIVGMTKSLSVELGRHGIRVNAILPGIVKGPRIERVIQDRADEVGVGFEEMKQQYLDKAALGRMVSQQDIADMALFLVSPMGRNIAGQALSVCGDVVAL